MDGNDAAGWSGTTVADGGGDRCSGESSRSNTADEQAATDWDDESVADSRIGSAGGDERSSDGGTDISDEPLSEALVDSVADRLPAVASAELTIPADADNPERLSSILVAVGGGPHSGAVIDVARRLAGERDAWIELFHVVGDEDDADAGERILQLATARLGEFERSDDWLVEETTPGDAVVEQSAYYDAVVVGAPTAGRVGRFVFGSTAERVRSDAAAPVIVVESDGSTSLVDLD